MQVLVERRYIFKRRSLSSRLSGLAVVTAVVMATWVSAATADATFGGYQRLSYAADPMVEPQS